MFIPVAPIQILEALKEQGAEFLGPSHLLLTHHVLEEPSRFQELFGEGGYSIIMDNSVVELGDAASDLKVFDAVRIVQGSGAKPNWVVPVLTDVMADGPATIDASHESYQWWKEKMGSTGPFYGLMVVLQGNSWETFCETADHFLTGDAYPHITWAGIPRILVDHLGTRERAIKYVKALRPDINIHLLGFSNNVTDDVICAQSYDVTSIDSAVPLRFNGVFTPTEDAGPRPVNWFEQGQYSDELMKNLHNARIWFS